jgi:hypothetical protein
MKECVYAVQVGPGRIKIGLTSDINKRLQSIKTASGEATLLRREPGNRDVERRLHYACRDQCINGEVFSNNGVVSEYIAGTFSANRLPLVSTDQWSNMIKKRNLSKKPKPRIKKKRGLEKIRDHTKYQKKDILVKTIKHVLIHGRSTKTELTKEFGASRRSVEMVISKYRRCGLLSIDTIFVYNKPQTCVSISTPFIEIIQQFSATINDHLDDWVSLLKMCNTNIDKRHHTPIDASQFNIEKQAVDILNNTLCKYITKLVELERGE